jgi:hypothetical protein
LGLQQYLCPITDHFVLTIKSLLNREYVVVPSIHTHVKEISTLKENEYEDKNANEKAGENSKQPANHQTKEQAN